jgi:two-component system cell cycle response regulator DivK
MPVTVLLVEDNPQNLYLETYLLENAGFRVLSCTDGVAGVAMAKENLPDLVLMDILLPTIDGYEATRRLKHDPVTAAIPVLALTAFSMEGDEQEAIAAGCDGYIAKPIEPGNFATKVTRFLSRFSGPGGSAAVPPDADR